MEKFTARSTIGREWTIEHNEHENEQIGQKEQEQLKKNPGGGEIFRTHPDRPWGPPRPLYNGYRVFPGDKAAEAL
jgi:hypothetical protein